jgi:hypothetical protein
MKLQSSHAVELKSTLFFVGVCTVGSHRARSSMRQSGINAAPAGGDVAFSGGGGGGGGGVRSGGRSRANTREQRRASQQFFGPRDAVPESATFAPSYASTASVFAQPYDTVVSFWLRSNLILFNLFL